MKLTQVLGTRICRLVQLPLKLANLGSIAKNSMSLKIPNLRNIHVGF